MDSSSLTTRTIHKALTKSRDKQGRLSIIIVEAGVDIQPPVNEKRAAHSTVWPKTLPDMYPYVESFSFIQKHAERDLVRCISNDIRIKRHIHFSVGQTSQHVFLLIQKIKSGMRKQVRVHELFANSSQASLMDGLCWEMLDQFLEE